MQLHRSLVALAGALIAATATGAAAVPQPASSAANTTTTTTVGCSLVIRSYRGGIQYPTGGYVAPYVSYYATFIQADHYAYCDFNEPAGLAYEMPCQGSLTPRVAGLATRPCPRADYNPLANVSYSVTRYGDRFVLQVDFADVGTGGHMTACETFDRTDFVCNGYYEYSAYRDLSAGVGLRCPTS